MSARGFCSHCKIITSCPISTWHGHIVFSLFLAPFWVRNDYKETTLLAMKFIKRQGDKRIYMQFMLIYQQIAGKVTAGRVQGGLKRSVNHKHPPVSEINWAIFVSMTLHSNTIQSPKMLREIQNWMKRINSKSTALNNVQHIWEASLKA